MLDNYGEPLVSRIYPAYIQYRFMSDWLYNFNLTFAEPPRFPERSQITSTDIVALPQGNEFTENQGDSSDGCTSEKETD